MSSTGQALGYVVGAIAGYFLGPAGGAMTGAAIGGAIGAALDPPKGPKLYGPRLSDLAQQGASYGTAIPRLYGTMATHGNVFWIENNALKETSKTQSSGGKGGGGGSSTTTYAYSATFALGLCEGPIAGIRRIWINGDLHYDAGSLDMATIIASNRVAPGFAVYTGSEDQLPDPRMQAALGVANTPAYRGLAYLVFYDLDLEKYGNTLVGAQIKVEVVGSGSLTNWQIIENNPATGVAFEANAVPGVGTPYIIRVDSEVHVGVAGSTVDYVFGMDGNQIARHVLTSNPVLQAEYFNGILWQPCGYITVTLGPGEKTHHRLYCQPGYLPSERAVLAFGPQAPLYRIDHNLPAGKALIGVYVDHSGEQITVISGPYNGDTGVEWTKINQDGDLLSSGTVEEGGSLYTFGYSRAATYHYAACDWDAASGLYVTAYGAGTGDLWIRQIGSDGVMRRIAGPSLPYFTYTKPTVYVDGESIFVMSGDEFYIYAKGAITSSTVTLGEIVQDECLQAGLLSAGDLDVSSLDDVVRGYRVASAGAIRAALEPLQGAWPFDVVPAGYQVRFVRRGVTLPVASIGEDDLGADTNATKALNRLTRSREMDSQLPVRVNLKFVDADREYDIGEQYVERLNTDAVNVQSTELAIVMTATEALRSAESLLYMYWLERYDFSFRLPPSYRHLEPADVIDVTVDATTYRLRITRLHYTAEGVIEVSARLNDPSTYASTALGANGTQSEGVITLPGSSLMEPLDIPAVLDSMDTSGFPVAMGGYSAAWKSGVLYRSIDGGMTWKDINAFVQPSIFGYVATPIGAPSDARFMDKSSVINATLFAGAEVASVTQTALFNGANHFAYGQDGRWEIIGAQRVVLQGDGTYQLTDLLRGRFGTEWAMGSHAANDRIVLLAADSLQFASLPINSIGMEMKYRAITQGASLDSDSDHDFTYRGVNLECLSPAYLTGSYSASNDWSLSWVRRTRIGGEWRDYVDASLGESAEAYEVDIYSDASYTAVKRTLTVSSPACTYTAAQQAADFGSLVGTLYLKVYQLSSVVGRGYPLVTSVSALGSDPYWLSTVSAAHFDGANGSTTFADLKGITLTAHGTPTISTAQSKFGGSSLSLSGSGQWLDMGGNAALALGAGDFTVEFWFYMNSATMPDGMFGLIDWRYASTEGPQIWIDSARKLCIYSNGFTQILGTVVNPITTWIHVALVRSGTNLRLYVNGVQDGSTYTDTRNYPVNAGRPLIGSIASVPGMGCLNGYIDDLRITKGVARYTGTFTPPVAAFPNF